MSQDYKSRFSQMRDNDLAAPQDNSGTDDNAAGNQYVTASHVRNICFAWPDGRRLFLNYSYLVSGEYTSEDGSIMLSFTTHVVTLKGLRLAGLYDELMNHTPRVITCAEARYNSLADGGPIVNEIRVGKTDQ